MYATFMLVDLKCDRLAYMCVWCCAIYRTSLMCKKIPEEQAGRQAGGEWGEKGNTSL